MKNQGNMTPPKKHNDFPVTYSKEMEVYELPDKEFKIIVLRKLSKLQGTQIHNEIRKNVNKMRSSIVIKII